MKVAQQIRVSQEILDLVPYQPGKPITEVERQYGITNVIKLASNENPLGPSPKVVLALTKGLGELHRYPDPVCFSLVEEVAKLWKLPKSQVAVGNGSNEIIDLLIRIYCEPGQAVMFSKASFVAYQVCAQAARVRRS